MVTSPGHPREVVLVTGCSTGLGRGLCVELSKRKGTLVVATARKLATITDLQESGAAALALELDVTSETSLKAAMERAAELGDGAIDAVICNAGMSSFGPAAQQPIAEMQRVMDTNVMGVIRTVQAAVPFMARPRCRGGRIVIIGSVSATLTTPFAGAYCASKAAINAFGEALRIELKPLGVSVTNVHAGAIISGFSANAENNSSLDVYADGPYAPVLSDIKRRIWISQRQKGAEQPEAVAQDIIRKCFNGGPAPGAITVAGGVLRAMLYGFLQKWLPAWFMDSRLAKSFGLNKLRAP